MPAVLDPLQLGTVVSNSEGLGVADIAELARGLAGGGQGQPFGRAVAAAGGGKGKDAKGIKGKGKAPPPPPPFSAQVRRKTHAVRPLGANSVRGVGDMRGECESCGADACEEYRQPARSKLLGLRGGPCVCGCHPAEHVFLGKVQG